MFSVPLQRLRLFMKFRWQYTIQSNEKIVLILKHQYKHFYIKFIQGRENIALERNIIIKTTTNI